MKKILFVLTCFLSLNVFLNPNVFAQYEVNSETLINQEIGYLKGTVTQIIDEGEEEVFGEQKLFQVFEVQLPSGESFVSEAGDWSLESEDQFVSVGDAVFVQNLGESYRVLDHNRLSPLTWLFVFFVLVIMAVGRKKGLLSLLGLLISIFLIVQWLIPWVLSGQNVLLVSIIGGTVISLISLYLSHGISKQTTISLVSIILVLGLAFIFSSLFVVWSKLSGLGTEQSFYIQLATAQTIDLRGLFLGGIIIGTIGVLDDVTTTQVAVVQSLRLENPTLTVQQLFTKAMLVGRTHIASLVNTLALAYTGAALPMFLLFHINQGQPWWITLNSEFVAEEIVRALCGSIALVLAVPISTYLAAKVLTRWPSDKLTVTACGCAHEHK